MRFSRWDCITYMNDSGTVCGLVNEKIARNSKKLCQRVCMGRCVFDESLYGVRRDCRSGANLARFYSVTPPAGSPIEKIFHLYTPPFPEVPSANKCQVPSATIAAGLR